MSLLKKSLKTHEKAPSVRGESQTVVPLLGDHHGGVAKVSSNTPEVVIGLREENMTCLERRGHSSRRTRGISDGSLPPEISKIFFDYYVFTFLVLLELNCLFDFYFS